VTAARVLQLLGERSVILIGMMGAGKSSIGRRLARDLGRPFLDSDSAVEEAARLSVKEIFALYGEDHFRACEQRVIERIFATPSQVVALGGGAWMSADIRAMTHSIGFSVWLDVDLSLLTQRVARRRTRPLLLTGDMRQSLEILDERRRPIYGTADIRIAADEAHPDVIVHRVMTEIVQFLSL